jgi:hypothetical protein
MREDGATPRALLRPIPMHVTPASANRCGSYRLRPSKTTDVARADDGDVHSLELLLFFARLRAVVRA